MLDKENRKPMQLNALDLLKHFHKALNKQRVSFIGRVKLRSLLGPVEKLIKHFEEAQDQRNGEKRRRPKTRVQPLQVDRRKPNPQTQPRERYEPKSYYRAVTYAIASGNRARLKEARRPLGRRATKKQIDRAFGKVEIPHWHPHRVRHTAASRIRKELVLEAARALLGQRSLAIADTYAELDQAVAIDAAKKLG